MLFLLHLSLEGVTEVDTDPKERFVSFKITTSICAPSEYSTREQLARGRFFEVIQKYIQIQMREIIVLWIKLTGLVKIKHKDFKGSVPIMLCLNSWWIMSLRIYWDGRTQIPPSSSATIGPLAKISIGCLYWSLAKDLWKQMNLGESGFSLLHRSCLYWYQELLKILRLIT